MSPRKPLLAVWMLVLATLFWGMGFAWSKNLGEALDRAAGVPETAAVGPVTGLAIRFTLAAVLWAVISPGVWRGWQWRTLWRGGVLGASLSLGLILQHIGLGLSDEAVIAFLTNLTVIFVPVWLLFVGRRWPTRPVMVAVPVALMGMALLSGLRGVGPVGSSAGAWWGVACAAAFAVEILLLDRFGRGESTAKLTLMLFVVSAVSCWAVAACLPGFGTMRWGVLTERAFLADMVPAVVLTTVIAFALMTRFQPKLDPTKAALLYLCEPLFAAGFAWLVNGRAMSADAVAGAALILSANVIAEWRWRRV